MKKVIAVNLKKDLINALLEADIKDVTTIKCGTFEITIDPESVIEKLFKRSMIKTANKVQQLPAALFNPKLQGE